MKKLTALFMTLILAAVFSCNGARATDKGARSIILMTEYQQLGWGDTFQLGALDADGNLWSYADSTRGDIPYEDEELLSWAETTDELELFGRLSPDELSDIVSLVYTVAAQDVVYQGAACDAGTQTSFAVRKDQNGNAGIIVLGASGDSLYENTDPAAQSLYLTLRKLFPDVISYYGELSISPIGFQSTNIMTFCEFEGLDLTQYKMTAYHNDCEEGPVEIEPAMSASEIMEIVVTGKKNGMFTTGNTVTYFFEDMNGEEVASFEFFDNLLVCPDGMYSICKTSISRLPGSKTS